MPGDQLGAVNAHGGGEGCQLHAQSIGIFLGVALRILLHQVPDDGRHGGNLGCFVGQGGVAHQAENGTPAHQMVDVPGHPQHQPLERGEGIHGIHDAAED